MNIKSYKEKKSQKNMFNDNMSKVNILLKLVSIQFKYYKETNRAILYYVTMTKKLNQSNE